MSKLTPRRGESGQGLGQVGALGKTVYLRTFLFMFHMNNHRQSLQTCLSTFDDKTQTFAVLLRQTKTQTQCKIVRPASDAFTKCTTNLTHSPSESQFWQMKALLPPVQSTCAQPSHCKHWIHFSLDLQLTKLSQQIRQKIPSSSSESGSFFCRNNLLLAFTCGLNSWHSWCAQPWDFLRLLVVLSFFSFSVLLIQSRLFRCVSQCRCLPWIKEPQWNTHPTSNMSDASNVTKMS